MATHNVSPTVGRPWVSLSRGMQALYAARGMWLDGRPQGLLASWLGERICDAPWPDGRVEFWITSERLDAMYSDAAMLPAQAWASGQQRGQFLRRLREAKQRAGAPVTGSGCAASPAPGRPADRQPEAPFDALVIPPAGTRAHRAFVEHTWRTLHDFVTYTQGSAYAADKAES